MVKKVHHHLDDFRVHLRGFGTEYLGTYLVKLAETPLLFSLVPEHRTGVVPASDLLALVDTMLNIGSHCRSCSFRTECKGASATVEEYSWSTAGSNDYKNQGNRTERIVDRNGVEYEPRWGDETIELFPGCTTSQKEGHRYVHVSSIACPVRVLRCQWYRYSTSDWEHDSFWEAKTWIRFEAEAEPGG